MEGKGLRQQPGFACEECRRRKARCDRGRPKCGFCTEAGTTCVIVNKRQQRGPKKGQLNAMRSQIEKQFDSAGGRAISKQPTPETELNSSRADNHDVPMDLGVIQKNGLDEEPSLNLGGVTSAPPDGFETTFMEHSDRVDAGPTSTTTASKLTDLMRVDLDQLYFDRVYPVCPIIHRSRYFAWASEESPGPGRACLRSAMRTMAAAMSAHWGDVVDHLVAETRHLLESNSQAQVTSRDEIPLEQIQSWLLLAYAELLRIGEHQAMLTAGRAFRLVQMARLYDVDALDDPQASPVATNREPDETFVNAEEKRRTFWLAFSLDRFLCLRSEWPLTLQEEMIRTRLPAPEANFQKGQPIRVSFLPAAMAENEPSTLSPFAECAVLAALYGRCMAHRRACAKEPGVKPYDFWTHQEWLASAVEKRIQMLDPCPAVDNDPMLLFTHILAQSSVVFLSNTVQRASWHTLEQQLVTAAYERRASVAALEINLVAAHEY
ncbi:hypothetical protein B0I37DRAFT_428901 [Chaetomium sp. MPI-CAGE-AT-0009]|nr:hypothetical protein B0I37DRAFT_428901 [Chaetomium sp. MPI-CAGE-AT-0009]